MADLETPNDSPEPRPVRRRKYRRWLVLAILVLGLVWLNGPGLRLLVPRVAVHFLEKAGLDGHLKITGNLTGGISISDLKITGDKALASLSIDSATPVYRWSELFKGRLDGLVIDGIHADLKLGVEDEEEKKTKPPLDLKQLVETMRLVREQVVPLNLELKDVSLAITLDGKPFLKLAPSQLSHATGSPEIELALGEFTDANDRVWPARDSSVVWDPDKLSVQRIDPFPGISLRELVVQLPAGGVPSADTELHLDEAVFVVALSPGFTSAKVDLREGSLQVGEVVKRFGVEIPASATLTSLAVEVDQLLPNPKAATGAVRVLLDNLAWEDWKSPELSLDATLAEDAVTLATHGMMLGTGFSLNAAAPVTRIDDAFSLGDATGKFNIADIPSALRELSARVSAIDPEAPVPASSVDGNFNIAILGNSPKAATADLVLKPQDDKLVSPVSIKARWAPDQPLAADLELDGLKAAATYQIEPSSYQATVVLDEFTNTRIDRWLSVVKVEVPGVVDLSGKWAGDGELKTGKHRGDLSFTQATWSREEVDPITAIGGVKYDWPASFETQGLRMQMSDQSVAVEAALAGGLLELRHFSWADGKTPLASGTASLPVPEDFAKWREMLAKDERPLAVDIHSQELSLALLKEWVPALEKLDASSTGQLDIAISGTYSEPVLEAKLEAKNLRSPAQPKLPPADLKITLVGRDFSLVLDGSATAPDFAPAVIKANLPFRPAEWAETPELLQEEPLDARVDLPRLDLSRFSSLVPSAEQLSGVLTGNVLVAGIVGKPVIKGSLDLARAGLRFKNDRFPAIKDLTVNVDLGLDRIDLKQLKSTIAGGTLSGAGSLTIAEGGLGEIDIRLRGDHLPVLRNDLLILRVNADLNIKGPWETATLSGRVGAVDSIFYRDIELIPVGSPFTTPSAASLPKFDAPVKPASSVPEPFRNWNVNLVVHTDKPVLIRGNLATGNVTANIRVGGTLGAPAPDGVVKLNDLSAMLPFSTLSVRSGTATFTPANGFDPVLEIRGTAEPRPYRVNVYAYGLASNPQLVLTSTPPMPENEIMTLLATGTTTAGLTDPQAASSRAMQLLAEEIRRGRFRFGKQLRPLLGLLDRVDFSLNEADPYSTESFSTATIELTDRWYVSAGVGATGDSRTMAIWRLSFR